MKLVVLLIIFITLILFLAQVSLQFKPLKISFEKPYLAIGWILVVFGIFFISLQSEKDSYKKAYEEMIKVLNDSKLGKSDNEVKI